MSNYHDSTDLSTLIGQGLHPDYLHEERERELLDAAASDFEGYEEWSEDLEETPCPENFTVRAGRVYERSTPKSNGFIGSIEW